MLLENKKVLVAVTGSIAIYKSLELIRLYIKAGAKVKVILTKGARKFINPITFEAISQSKVLVDEDESWDKDSIDNHIDIGKWADVCVVAPCSANTINKLASGIADNLLTEALLAFIKAKVIAPAANTNMIKNPITQENLKKLERYGYEIISTQSKELICKDFGDGAMADVEDIFYATAKELLKEDYWKNRNVLLSGGGTIEKIDDVRYISNFSSGKMASSMALALYLKGANVFLVSSRGHENLPKAIETYKVESSMEMFETLDELAFTLKRGVYEEGSLIIRKPFLFMVAAVSDYLPQMELGKLKKEELGENWNLELRQNIDILKSINKDGLISIGFKAEMDEDSAFDSASKMLENKNLDAVCLNVLKENNSFGSSYNEIDLILKNKKYSCKGEKLELSLELINNLQKEFINVK